jgi:hypothetical protein
VPAVSPATTPLALPTVATVVLLLLHVPPSTVLDNVVDDPTHTEFVPVIVPDVADVVTAISLVEKTVPQLVFTVYVIMVVPASTPVTTPLALIVATLGVLLLQVPPVTGLVSVVVSPVHKLDDPLITPAVGAGVMVATTVLIHPVANLYVIIVVPTATPISTPVPVPIVAMAALLLLHVPPAVELVSVLVVPTQVVALPAIAPGNSFTVNTAVRKHPVLSV